jgi:hypothetical protein
MHKNSFLTIISTKNRRFFQSAVAAAAVNFED